MGREIRFLFTNTPEDDENNNESNNDGFIQWNSQISNEYIRNNDYIEGDTLDRIDLCQKIKELAQIIIEKGTYEQMNYNKICQAIKFYSTIIEELSDSSFKYVIIENC